MLCQLLVCFFKVFVCSPLLLKSPGGCGSALAFQAVRPCQQKTQLQSTCESCRGRPYKHCVCKQDILTLIRFAKHPMLTRKVAKTLGVGSAPKRQNLMHGTSWHITAHKACNGSGSDQGLGKEVQVCLRQADASGQAPRPKFSELLIATQLAFSSSAVRAYACAAIEGECENALSQRC